MECLIGGAFGPGAAACIPGTEVAVASSSSGMIIPALFILLVMYFEHEKGKI